MLVVLLIVATMVVDGVMVAWGPRGEGRPPDGAVLALTGLACSHVNLVAALAALGAIPLPSGLACVVLIALCLSGVVVLACGPLPPPDFPVFAAVLLMQVVVTLATTFVARIAGARILVVAPPTSVSEHGQRAKFQFTLGRLFDWVTCTAIILGVLRYTIDPQTPELRDIWDGPLAAATVVHPALAIIAMGAVLTALPWGTRATLLVLATGTAIVADHCYVFDDVERAVTFALPQVAWLVAALAVLRVAGYRLVRRGAIAAGTSPTAGA